MTVSPPKLDVIDRRRKSGTKFVHSIDEGSFQAGLMLVMYDDGLLFFAIQQIVKEYGSDWKDHMSHDETMSVPPICLHLSLQGAGSCFSSVQRDLPARAAPQS